MKKALILPVFLLMTFRAISQIPCIVPGNPGTVDLPAPCPYSIVPGIEFTSNLPPGSTLLLSGFLNGFACTHPVCPFPGICEIPGGILGGTMVCYSCNLNLTVMGTGVFAGYMRTLVIPGIMSYHTAPRTTGLPVQEFQCEMMMLLFEVVGDPDFSLLRIASGLEMQLPGSGTTALTKMPDGQWWVESFFDVFTEVTINGNPQGPLGNVAGSGVYPSRLWQGIPAPKGACCLQVSKSCITTSQVDCFYRNGVYYGDNSSCDTVNCGPLTDSFQIVMNPQGSPLIAGGSGQYEDTNYNIGGWYLYPNTGWWNIWYYDHPLDTSRFKRIDISFYVAPMDPNLPGWIEVAANWSTPLWSLQGDTSVSRRPPVPGIPGMNETLHIGRHTLFAFQGFIQPGFQQLCFYVENYNPEWVSVDVRGENFQLEQGQIVHECIHGQLPPIGRCCYLDNNNVWQCADNFECECSALNGSWNDTLNCTANPCPVPVDSGACCLPNKQCVNASQTSCLAAGGVFKGVGSSCDTVNCGPITNTFYITRGNNPQPGIPPLNAGGTGQFDNGAGFNGWYWYETYDWWNIWYYDHPYDTSRWKMVTISFDVWVFNPQFPFDLDFALNWSMPAWSLQGITTPPLPPIPPSMEDMIIGRHIFPTVNLDPTIGMQHFDLCYIFPDFNPEWVSVDVRGYNFEILNGVITHECIFDTLPHKGRCCYPDATGMIQCADIYQCECAMLGGTWDVSPNCTANPCPQPQGACCMPDGSCVQTDINTCGQILHGMWMGVGVPCVPNPCPQPEPDSGACCYPDGSCMYRDSISCIQTGGAYQGDGVSCTPNPCPQPHGACCMPDGSCVQTDINTCGQILHGMWMGVGVPCVPNPCPQPEPDSGACCYPDGSCMYRDSISCIQTGGTYQGDGVSCMPNPCPQPQGACCMPDGSCVQTDINTCGQILHGMWMGVGIPCVPNPCPQPQGACCMPDGSCVQTDINTCGQILHGMWMGAGVPCVPNPCPQPEPDSGACCYPDGSCMYRDSISCIQTGGTYQGDGVSCMPNPCPQPQGACCMPDGSCVQTDINTCGQILHGMWMGVGIPCVPNPCPQPQGACCMPDGSCVQTDINTCGQILHGMWMGVGIPCVPNPCTAMPDTIIGVVIYGNTARTPMRGVSVILSKSVLNIDTAVTDTSGVFRFLAWPGSYHLKAFYHGTWPHGAANANDALLVMKHFVGLDTVYGIHWLAGDVNASHNLSTTDAMQIAQRFVGMIPSFAAGDWAFLEYDITVGGSPKSSTSVTMEGLVYGDANASYTFGMKKETGPGLVKDNPLQVKPMESVMIPVRVSQAASIASASLSIRYASHSFDIVTINSESNQGSLVFKTSDGILRIAWYDIEESNLEQADVLFWITATVKPLRLRSLTELSWEILPESELTGFNGKALDVDLMIPDLQLMPSGLTVGQNKPNPFTKMTDIDFFISEPGMVHFEVMNPLGQQIAVLAHGQMEAGRHEVSFDCRNCPPGVYFYRVLFTGTTEREVITRRMILQ